MYFLKNFFIPSNNLQRRLYICSKYTKHFTARKEGHCNPPSPPVPHSPLFSFLSLLEKWSLDCFQNRTFQPFDIVQSLLTTANLFTLQLFDNSHNNNNNNNNKNPCLVKEITKINISQYNNYFIRSIG